MLKDDTVQTEKPRPNLNRFPAIMRHNVLTDKNAMKTIIRRLTHDLRTEWKNLSVQHDSR